VLHGTHGRSVFSTELNVLQSSEEFLREQNVPFTDRDITSDAAALTELEKLGLMTTPVTMVDGETVVGYDVNRLKTLVGI
jgi:hypothetical protein